MNGDPSDNTAKALPSSPWSTVRSSIFFPNAEEEVSYQDAHEQPCRSCGTASCCSLVSLSKVLPKTAADIDYLHYLVNFERIELGLKRNGEVGVYYRWGCRHLDREKLYCTIHKTPDQPRTCIHYRAHTCWYRKAVGEQTREDYIRFDWVGFDVFVNQITFDGDGKILSAPSWQEMKEIVVETANLVVNATEAGQLIESKAPRSESLEPDKKTEIKNENQPFAGLVGYRKDPCTDCSAPCCDHVAIRTTQLQSFMGLDFVRYMLGFEGIEYGYSESGQNWVFVRSECRAFDTVARKCTLYGSPKRPAACTSYNAWKCSFKPWFTTPDTSNLVRIKFEQFKPFAKLFRFDRERSITQAPSITDVREAIYAQQ